MVEVQTPLTIKQCLNVSYYLPKWRRGPGASLGVWELLRTTAQQAASPGKIQLLQHVIFCLQSSYCICNWIRIKRFKGCGLGIRLLSWTPVKPSWREVGCSWLGEDERKGEGLGTYGPGCSWQQVCCSLFSLGPTSLIFLRYRGSTACKVSLGVTYPCLDISFLLCRDKKAMLPSLKVLSCLISTHPLVSFSLPISCSNRMYLKPNRYLLRQDIGNQIRGQGVIWSYSSSLPRACSSFRTDSSSLIMGTQSG